MKTLYRGFLTFFLLFFINFSGFADHLWTGDTYDDWVNNMHKLTFSPRYFGPNAFPIPKLRNGLTYDRWEIELRWENHKFSGDHTRNWYIRGVIPFVKGKAALEIWYTFHDSFHLSPETQRERHAAELRSPTIDNGDVVLSAIFQILKKKEWVDALFSMTFKTASGDRVAYARYTDAASYWFDLNIAKDLYRNDALNASLRAQVQGGFYCWMTNNLTHRQNDAFAFGIGLTGTYGNFTLSSDFSGFKGYENNGDKPLVLRNNLQYDYKKNILSLRYNHGMKDNLYKTFSIGYIRCF